ncbi:hypothetical protein RIEGSTA812A_PEG_382 [invertebrate metagenome]|uniref:Uncharacterized protein n=1 Tax=invertebrate metagenome TaxID=1711999 RepID=A0A484H4Y2_9ZZZZ
MTHSKRAAGAGREMIWRQFSLAGNRTIVAKSAAVPIMSNSKQLDEREQLSYS